MKKATRILTTILILSIATTLYSFCIVPALEPDSKYQKEEQEQEFPELSKQQIKSLFQPNDWENDSYRQLNYNNYHFFIGDYDFLSPESILLNKCTIVIVNPQKPSNAIIIRCLGQISITLEKPFSHGLDDNRILNGTITDEIQVISKGDDETLSLKTRDFNIDRDFISTNANVYFKYGRTQGQGEGMRIQLISQGLLDSQNFNPDSSFISQIVANITLEKLHRLTVVPPANNEANNHNDDSGLFNSPVELSCDGEFVFSALDKCASFERNVSLIQTVANKAPNSIRCQHLNLFFSLAQDSDSYQETNEENEDSDTDDSFDDWNFQLERLEAIGGETSGSQVVVEAPEYETKILADRLTANLSPLSFELYSTSRQCEIHYKNHVISAQNLIYFVGKDGALGTLECNCPGWISSQIEQGGKQIRARWSDHLHLEPEDNDPGESKVSIQGGAWLEVENNKVSEATITADNFSFWLTRTTGSAQSNGFEKLTLSRMQALDNVVMKSKPITAKVNRLQLWFEELDSRKEAAEGNRQETLGINNDSPASYSLLPATAASNSELNHSYTVSGNQLQGEILIGQEPFQIKELKLEGGVRIVQNGNDNKLEMSGNLIEVNNVTLPSVTARLIGQPAKIRYNNALLTGAAINVNRETNHIWISSNGEAIFLGNTERETGNSNSSEATLNSPSDSPVLNFAKIQWSESMEFKNDTLTFTGMVSLQRAEQIAQCDTLSIVLNKKVDFQNLSSEEQKSLDVRFVILNNSVKLKNYTRENGVLAAMDTLTASKMTLDMKNQMFVAEGPGCAITQRKMKGNDETQVASNENAQDANSGNREQGTEKTNSPETNTTLASSSLLPSPNSLINLSVEFQKRLVGSFNPRALQTYTFSGYVQAVYSPIDEIGKTLKTSSLSALPPQAFTLKCNQMEIQADFGNRQEGIENLNSSVSAGAFIASNGVKLESLNYNADADRITFEGKRGMMTLEGSDSKPAHLFYQKVPGGIYNQASSSTIYYNTQTGAVKGEGIQDFSLFLMPKQ